MGNKVDYLVEWAVWGHLDSQKNLELVILKGHLLLENILEVVLDRSSIKDFKNYSFYKKIQLLKIIDFENKRKKEFIISNLESLNNLRNKLAHEILYDVSDGEL